MKIIIKENIFNLFEQAEKIFETVIDKIRNNEDVVFNQRDLIVVKYKPDFIFMFTKKMEFKADLSYDREAKKTFVAMKYKTNIFDELDSLQASFVHEYTHYKQFSNSNPGQGEKMTKLPSKRKYKKMYLEPQPDDKFYLTSLEGQAHINKHLYIFYNEYVIPMWNRIKSNIRNLYLEGFYELEDVEKMIQKETIKEFSAFYRTLPENMKAIFDGIKQRNSRPQQRKYFLQVIAKITKRIIDQFLEQI